MSALVSFRKEFVFPICRKKFTCLFFMFFIFILAKTHLIKIIFVINVYYKLNTATKSQFVLYFLVITCFFIPFIAFGS